MANGDIQETAGAQVEDPIAPFTNSFQLILLKSLLHSWKQCWKECIDLSLQPTQVSQPVCENVHETYVSHQRALTSALILENKDRGNQELAATPSHSENACWV